MRDTDAQAPTQSSPPTAPTRPLEEIARLGDDIYKRDIRQLVETDHVGEVVSIDVESGRWAIGDNTIVATDRLRKKRPEAIDVWSVRVGYRTMYNFGGRPLRRTE